MKTATKYLTSLTGNLLMVALASTFAASAFGADKLKVVTSTAGIIFSPAYVAQQQGYFKEEGLDVEVADGNGGSNAVAAIVGGSAQIGFVGIKNASQAVVKGQPLKVVATGIRGFPQAIVLQKSLVEAAHLKPDASLAEKGALLRNKIIAVSDIGGSTGDFARFVLRQANIPADQVRLINIASIQGQLAALKAKRIDGFVNASPATEMAVAGGYGVDLILPSRDLKDATDFEYTVQIVREDLIKSHPELVERYLRGMQKALDFIRANPDAAKKSAYAFLSDQAETNDTYPPAIRDAAWKNTLPYFPVTVALDNSKLAAARAFFDISDRAPDSILVDNALALKAGPPNIPAVKTAASKAQGSK
jgi:NitT/TauT family transport system substrate-binding protein